MLSRKRSISISSTSGSDNSIDLTKEKNHKRTKVVCKMDEVERLAEMERQRRQREAEQHLIDEETTKRIEEVITKRVNEVLKVRREEIELRLSEKVEEAKVNMDRELREEKERRRQRELLEEKIREVRVNLWPITG